MIGVYHDTHYNSECTKTHCTLAARKHTGCPRAPSQPSSVDHSTVFLKFGGYRLILRPFNLLDYFDHHTILLLPWKKVVASQNDQTGVYNRHSLKGTVDARP
ncbi:hypothetical protein DL546_007006 [Coniochaeta pulveracea]|uniref:Uncharacterized protein n=1 Tax=Coniochaeta pulveracea TaxID=177199 RepID=A0A420YFV4_9PEZI|nr:hypothetical protein DL546_007006 [Coniochaeta pulveracea]